MACKETNPDLEKDDLIFRIEYNMTAAMWQAQINKVIANPHISTKEKKTHLGKITYDGNKALLEIKKKYGKE